MLELIPNTEQMKTLVGESLYQIWSYSTPESQEIVRVDFHNPDTISYEQPQDMVSASVERNSISEASPMKLSFGSFLHGLYGNFPRLRCQATGGCPLPEFHSLAWSKENSFEF